MIQAEDVAHYLRDHPEFFEEYADLLASTYVPHPHGGRAIPLAERQVLSLRDKSRALESKLRELVQFGERNDSISDRVHRICLALMVARDFSTLLDSLYHNLREDFAVPAVAVRLWAEGGALARPEWDAVSQEARVFAESLTQPYFSERPMFESGAWFAEPAAKLLSYVYVPLRAERALGVLVLASDDTQRFSADMGTLYLTRLSELISMALKRTQAG